MINDKILFLDPYSQTKTKKAEQLLQCMRGLVEHHRENCESYNRILKSRDVTASSIRTIADIPFLPVRLFKDYTLRSVAGDQVFKTMKSSGTTGQKVSQIFLDREATALQTKILTTIVSSHIGKARLPMLVLDTASVMQNRNTFSARAAGIRGFSIFARNQHFAFDEQMKLDQRKLGAFLDKYGDKKFLVFGFTFMIWKHFYNALQSLNYRPDMSKAFLIHGGGWKTLTDVAVDAEAFKSGLAATCRIPSSNIRDYYGMVEQTGTIHMECEHGVLHTSVYGDVIVRRHTDFKPVAPGESGVIQVLSVLPTSYPGHSLLTEDEGKFLGEDDCPCGRKGKYFKVLGRLKNAETRGCSDTYAQQMA
ncbi:hypothetical protein OAF37_02190 [Rubripirellula sp.]|nr:hypothetical protein [Rubripirellula sp.]MDB4644845.1 hypothetical protein [Rubripirellula sp.]